MAACVGIAFAVFEHSVDVVVALLVPMVVATTATAIFLLVGFLFFGGHAADAIDFTLGEGEA